MEITKKKIFAIVPPGSGHLNPVLCLLGEMMKHQKVHVVIYSDENFREKIEKIGAEYRAFSHPTYTKVVDEKPINQGRKMTIGDFLSFNIDIAYDVLPQLLRDVENETPDMIIYDSFFIMSRYLFEIIKTREANGTWNRKVPKSVMFIPNFPPCKKMLRVMMKDMPIDFWGILLLIDSFRKQFMFSWTYGISVYNPLGLFMKNNEVMNIVSVPVELHPYPEEFDDTFKFVGPCVSDHARSIEIYDDDELRAILNQFEIKELGKQSKSELKLIYVSMGTVFTANTFIFERIFDAFRDYDSRPSRRFKLAQLRVIFSVGPEGLKIFKDKIEKGELDLPSNLILKARVPQLEILKRADLFVTHCGMNSTTETIKFGVPVVAVPIGADQPYNSRRICDELEFGLRHDPLNLKSDEIADSIDQVLGDDKYRNKIGEMSKAVQKYNGSVDGARLVLDYLNKND